MERFFDFFSWLLKVLSCIGILAGFYTWFTLSAGGISNLANKKSNRAQKIQGLGFFALGCWIFIACILVLINQNSLAGLASFVGFGVYLIWDSHEGSGRLSKLTLTTGWLLFMPLANALWILANKIGG